MPFLFLSLHIILIEFDLYSLVGVSALFLGEDFVQL